jgi:hypothetical protein
MFRLLHPSLSPAQGRSEHHPCTRRLLGLPLITDTGECPPWPPLLSFVYRYDFFEPVEQVPEVSPRNLVVTGHLATPLLMGRRFSVNLNDYFRMLCQKPLFTDNLIHVLRCRSWVAVLTHPLISTQTHLPGQSGATF